LTGLAQAHESLVEHRGGCHCGRVRFRVTGTLGEVSDCNCSMCTKKGFVHWIMPPGQFELLSGKDDLTIGFTADVRVREF